MVNRLKLAKPFCFIVFVVLILVSSNHGIKDYNKRVLKVATCDSRSGWKEFSALKLWNITGRHLHNEGLSMINVCKGENWGKFGFLTKPLKYLEFLRSIDSNNTNMVSTYVILMDSDTYWSAQNLQHIWKNFDLARNNRELVVSSEMSCWVGRYCDQADLDKWYQSPQLIPSYSPFVNSGVIMGRVDLLIEMMEHVINNNGSYFTNYGKKYKFDDQLAIADYALRIAPSKIAVDYHQLISASCSIHAPGNPPDEGWPFLCKNRNGTFSFSCHIYNNLLKRQGHFFVNSSNCLVQRNVGDQMSLKMELSSLSFTPIIWHGNGKKLF